LRYFYKIAKPAGLSANLFNSSGLFAGNPERSGALLPKA